MLKYEARRRPEINALYQKALNGSLTEEELDSAKLPLPWFRKALIAVQHGAIGITALAATEAYIMASGGVREGVTRDTDGSIIQYLGEDIFIPVSKAGSTLMIKYGDYMFMPKSGGIWIDTIFVPAINRDILSHHQVIKDGSRMDYISFRKSALLAASDNSNNTSIIDFTNGRGQSPFLKYGVRFS